MDYVKWLYFFLICLFKSVLVFFLMVWNRQLFLFLMKLSQVLDWSIFCHIWLRVQLKLLSSNNNILFVDCYSTITTAYKFQYLQIVTSTNIGRNYYQNVAALFWICKQLLYGLSFNIIIANVLIAEIWPYYFPLQELGWSCMTFFSLKKLRINFEKVRFNGILSETGAVRYGVLQRSVFCDPSYFFKCILMIFIMVHVMWALFL